MGGTKVPLDTELVGSGLDNLYDSFCPYDSSWTITLNKSTSMTNHELEGSLGWISVELYGYMSWVNAWYI